MNTDKDDIKQITNEINKDNMCIILIHHKSCGHCIELKPKWEMVKKHHKNNPIKIIDIEASYLEQFDHPIKNNVTGFPTIMSTLNGKLKNNYMGERSIEGLNKFINNNMKLIVKKKINNLNKQNRQINNLNGQLLSSNNQYSQTLTNATNNEYKQNRDNVINNPNGKLLSSNNKYSQTLTNATNNEYMQAEGNVINNTYKQNRDNVINNPNVQLLSSNNKYIQAEDNAKNNNNGQKNKSIKNKSRKNKSRKKPKNKPKNKPRKNKPRKKTKKK